MNHLDHGTEVNSIKSNTKSIITDHNKDDHNAQDVKAIVRGPIPAAAVPDYMWQAVIANDRAYDGQFFYGVTSTRIFCRPSCKSRPPKKEHVFIFQHAEQALQAEFRPCKRCKPTGVRLPEQEWIDIVKTYIDDHYASPVTLNTLADISHSSPYHLQRTFKRLMGISPNAYVQEVRIQHAKERLRGTKESIADIGAKVGMDNVSYFVTLFKQKTGMTPSAYRENKASNTMNDVCTPD